MASILRPVRLIERGLYFHDPGHRIVPIHHGITAAHDEGVIDETLNHLDDLFSAF
jgi:hypothetical protein